MRFLAILCFFLSLFCQSQTSTAPLGTWQEQLPYGSAIDVTATTSAVYCATPYSLFNVSTDTKELQRKSKITGLSETGISTIKFSATTGKLVVAYTNSNIDVLSSTGIRNIPDLKRKTIAGDKTVYHIYPFGSDAYLSTGFGIVVIDLAKNEIRDAWTIGNNGNAVKTMMVARDSSFFYAATTEGLKKASMNAATLADFHSWQNTSGANGLAAVACRGVINVQNKIIALQNDSLFVAEGGNWKFLYANGWPVTTINTTENKILLCQRTAAGDSKVTVLNADGSVYKVLQQPGLISSPQQAIAVNNSFWIADLFGSLSQATDAGFESFKPASPEDVASGELVAANGTFYAAAGSVNSSWNYQYNRNGVYQQKGNNWTNYNGFHFPQLDSLLDFVTIAVDNRDGTVWAGSYGGGLVHIKGDNNFIIYKQSSPIGPAIGDPTSYRVSGLAFDAQQNLWVANFGAAKYLHVLKPDGSWLSFTSPFSLFQNAVSQIVTDDNNGLWIVSPLGNGLIYFNHGTSLENTADDVWKLYRTGAGAGNLPANDVLCIARDNNGLIWIGTTDGIGLVQCTDAVNPCDAVLPVVQQGGFANYLFKGTEVRSIAVDAANRKWIATSNGAFLISESGEEVLFGATEENSPLLSNDVKRIAVDNSTGEVFFATAKGLCSFKASGNTTARHPLLTLYPNPVPPGYSGGITITGLGENSIVKITELNGRLVYQTRSAGGQAVWNGKEAKGKSINTGVYLVLETDETGKERGVGKIIFIQQ